MTGLNDLSKLGHKAVLSCLICLTLMCLGQGLSTRIKESYGRGGGGVGSKLVSLHINGIHRVTTFTTSRNWLALGGQALQGPKAQNKETCLIHPPCFLYFKIYPQIAFTLMFTWLTLNVNILGRQHTQTGLLK